MPIASDSQNSIIGFSGSAVQNSDTASHSELHGARWVTLTVCISTLERYFNSGVIIHFILSHLLPVARMVGGNNKEEVNARPVAREAQRATPLPSTLTFTYSIKLKLH